jgi:site-specific recombinase XerD
MNALTAQRVTAPLAFSGMSRETAIAYVNRFYDAVSAGHQPLDDEAAIERFLNQCSGSNSAGTRSCYRLDLACLVQWLNQDGRCIPLRGVTRTEALGYVEHLRGLVAAARISPRTFNRRVTGCRSFYRWASGEGVDVLTGITRNPFPRGGEIKVGNSHKAISTKHWRLLRSYVEIAAVNGGYIEKRDLAMVILFYETGARASEIAALKWTDIKDVDSTVTIEIRGKGAKTRHLVLPEDAADALQDFEACKVDTSTWVFPGPKSSTGHLTRQAIANRFKVLGDTLGIKLGPCIMRHTHATHAVREGVDVFSLSESMGHASVATTAIYVKHAQGSKLRQG